MSKKRETDIRVAANELCGALTELVYITTKEIGGARHEEHKRRFATAVVMLVRAIEGQDPLTVKYK